MRTERVKPELCNRYELFHFLGRINAAFPEPLVSCNSCAGLWQGRAEPCELPVCVVAVSGAAPRGRAHGRGLAGHAHGVALAQVPHPARVRARLQSALLRKGLCPELHTVPAPKQHR